MANTLSNFKAIGEAVAALTHPHGEVVLHDLGSGKIAAIWNGFSGRRIGDESLIDDLDAGPSDSLGPYRKLGPGGEHIKTVSAVLRGEGGEPAWLLCINLDVTAAEQAARYLTMVVAASAPKPERLFAGDWRERIQELIHHAAAERRKPPAALSRHERTELVARLDAEHLFETRNAADHAAAILNVSRTSLYNYLRAARRGSGA